ncbi:hypothetical protein GCM10007979_14410 [Nocardioides albus]|nr:hypothetical protein GCM10007979_14410 [Nocardioides albus]
MRGQRRRLPPIQVGEQYGVLTVLSEAEAVRNGNTHRRRWHVSCSNCGQDSTVRQDDLRRESRRNTCCVKCRMSAGTNPRWTPEPTYAAMHLRVKSERGAAGDHECIDCGGQAADWSYVRGCSEERLPIDSYARAKGNRSPYCPHEEHYAPRCRGCHAKMDKGELHSVRRLRTVLLANLGDADE